VGSQTITHYDLVLLVAVSFGLIAGALVYLGWKGRQLRNSTQKIEQMTKAVGSLVVQETGKIRALLNR
jgi:hypothetical protein